MIRHKDHKVAGCYIGSTCNLHKRMIKHKSRAFVGSPTDSGNLRLYSTIRANGGWTNYKVDVLEEYPCASFEEARKREREHFDLHKPTLNMVRPHSTRAERLGRERDSTIACSSFSANQIKQTVAEKITDSALGWAKKFATDTKTKVVISITIDTTTTTFE